jgi:hypothetical protein
VAVSSAGLVQNSFCFSPRELYDALVRPSSHEIPGFFSQAFGNWSEVGEKPSGQTDRALSNSGLGAPLYYSVIFDRYAYEHSPGWRIIN